MAMDIPQTSSESERVIHEVERAIVGKRALLERVMAGVICGGHILLEDYPGLGKTLLAKSFAVVLGLAFKRIQFTPDLLPTDITGGYVFDRDRNGFVLRPGPVFANIILADEINRASPKTQSALLEAMQEHQVTLEGATMPLPDPFIVMATQNPIEYEGTFPLPEAQLDRFVMKLSVGYPSPDEEREILHRRGDRQSDDISLLQVTDGERLLGLRHAVERVHVDGDIEQYIVDLVSQTRRRRQVAVGASPRASLALLKLARAGAAMQGRSYVLPDDVKRYVRPVLIHRLILQPDLWMNRDAADEVISDILESVAVPVVDGA
jgi:MoxR-like ATPase